MIHWLVFQSGVKEFWKCDSSWGDLTCLTGHYYPRNDRLTAVPSTNIIKLLTCIFTVYTVCAISDIIVKWNCIVTGAGIPVQPNRWVTSWGAAASPDGADPCRRPCSVWWNTSVASGRKGQVVSMCQEKRVSSIVRTCCFQLRALSRVSSLLTHKAANAVAVCLIQSQCF